MRIIHNDIRRNSYKYVCVTLVSPSTLGSSAVSSTYIEVSCRTVRVYVRYKHFIVKRGQLAKPVNMGDYTRIFKGSDGTYSWSNVNFRYFVLILFFLIRTVDNLLVWFCIHRLRLYRFYCIRHVFVKSYNICIYFIQLKWLAFQIL